MSWEVILKISTGDAISDAKRVMEGTPDMEDEPRLELDTSLNLLDVKNDIQDVRKGYGLMAKALTSIAKEHYDFGGFTIGKLLSHLNEMQEPIEKLEESMKRIGEMQ